MATQYALDLACMMGYGCLALEGDSLMVINAVKNRTIGATPVFLMLKERAMLWPIC